jgi:lysophospholipase L1-like esterase
MEPVRAILPRLEEITIDGDPADWPADFRTTRIFSDVYGSVPDTGDFHAAFRLAWSIQGLLVLAEIRDDVIYEDHDNFWKGDGMEIFISPTRGSFDIMQISVRPSYETGDSSVFIEYYDHRKSAFLRERDPAAVFAAIKAFGNYVLEGMIPLSVIGIDTLSPGIEMAIQLYLNDADEKDDTLNYSLPWYPVRDASRNPFAYQPVQLGTSDTRAIVPELRAYVQDEVNLIIKVLSDRAGSEKDLRIRSPHLNRHFRLQEEEQGIFSGELVLNAEKYRNVDEQLHFLRKDSLFYSLDPVSLHRVYTGTGKPKRFEEEIRIFEILDHFQGITEDAVLFTGSSTIRKWHTLSSDLPQVPILNRGFGGSTMKDLNYHRERIVFPYKPGKIFVYEGDNDLASGTLPEEFIKDCREFILACQARIPETKIYFLSIKPSPARIHLLDEMQLANQMLDNLCQEFEQAVYINISVHMLDEDGMPKPFLYDADRLHLNEAGYRLLTEIIRPYL